MVAQLPVADKMKKMSKKTYLPQPAKTLGPFLTGFFHMIEHLVSDFIRLDQYLIRSTGAELLAENLRHTHNNYENIDGRHVHVGNNNNNNNTIAFDDEVFPILSDW